MADPAVTTDLPELAPEPPPRGPVVWARENLFSSVASSILTVVAVAIVTAGLYGFLAYLFGEDRQWDAVTENMRLLMVQAYPSGAENSQIHRVWLTVGTVFALLAFSFAVYRVGGRTSVRQVARSVMGVGGALLVVAVLAPFSASGRLAWGIAGAVLIGAGYLAIRAYGERAKEPTLPVLGVVAVLIALVIAALWVMQVPRRLADGSTEFQGLASTTTLPWTIIAVLLPFAYFAGRAVLRRFADHEEMLRRILSGVWVASFPILVLVVLRDPDIDYERVFRFFTADAAELGVESVSPLDQIGLLWWSVLIAAGGAVLLSWMSSRKAGEAGRAVAGLLVFVFVASFLIPMPYLVRFLLLSLALFGLGAPTFGGEGAARNRYLRVWLSWVVILSFLVILVNTESSVEVPGNFFLGGLALTFLIAITAIAASFPIGVVMALARTSTLPLFRVMSTAYIELVRGVPLITWLLVAFLMFPVALPEGIEIGGVVRAIIFIAFFSGAYLAENVRGGLQSIGRGQYEAAKALGMGTVQMTVFIVLPQALRAVIPALVGQVIALFKDTSLVTIVGLFDFLHIARFVIPNQSNPFNFLGSIKETLVFAAVVYWIFTFTFSRVSLRLEKKLGVGER